MTSQTAMASSDLRRLLTLTERLTERLQTETAAISRHRAQDISSGIGQTQEMANQYRRESAQLKANPSILAAAPASERMALIRATETFETVLAAHARAVEAARVVSEGLVQTIAHEVASARAMGTGYGAGGHANSGDGRAVTYNRTA